MSCNSPCEIQYHGPALFSNFQDLQFAPTEQWRPGAGGGPPCFQLFSRGLLRNIKTVGIPLDGLSPSSELTNSPVLTLYFDNWAKTVLVIGYGWHGVAPELASGDRDM